MARVAALVTLLALSIGCAAASERNPIILVPGEERVRAAMRLTRSAPPHKLTHSVDVAARAPSHSGAIDATSQLSRASGGAAHVP